MKRETRICRDQQPRSGSETRSSGSSSTKKSCGLMSQTEAYIRELIIDRRPWGRACGLLVSCLVILIGIARSVAPNVIALRAVAAGLVAAICIRGFVRLLQSLAEQDADSRPG